MTNFEIWRQGLTANYFLVDIYDENDSPIAPEETIFSNCVGCPVRCYRDLFTTGQTCAERFLEWAGGAQR